MPCCSNVCACYKMAKLTSCTPQTYGGVVYLSWRASCDGAHLYDIYITSISPVSMHYGEHVLWWSPSLWCLHDQCQSCIYALWRVCVAIVIIFVTSPWRVSVLYLCIMEVCVAIVIISVMSPWSISVLHLSIIGSICCGHHLCNVSMTNFSPVSMHRAECLLGWDSSLWCLHDNVLCLCIVGSVCCDGIHRCDVSTTMSCVYASWGVFVVMGFIAVMSPWPCPVSMHRAECLLWWSPSLCLVPFPLSVSVLLHHLLTLTQLSRPHSKSKITHIYYF